MPAVFYVCVRASLVLAGNAHVKLKDVFLGFSYILVPLGLLAWIAFSFPLIFVNGSYILTTMSDPFGWGWDLFGTANIAWRPLIPEYLGYIQLLLLGVGLYYALKRGGEIAERLFGSTRATWALLPVGLFATGVTLAFAKVFLG